MLTEITDHVAQALGRLRQQYRGKPRLAALITAIVGPIQDLETAFQDLTNERSISTASGFQLDQLGTIFDLDRLGAEDDESYRARLAARAAQNVSQGEPETLIALYQLLTGADLVYLGESFPAGVRLYSDVGYTDQAQINALYEQVKLALPAGVRLEQLGAFDPVTPFAFAGSAPGSGFDDGILADLYLNTNLEFAFDGTDVHGGGFGDNKDPLLGGVFLT